jgi:hypothetical protein
VLESFQDTHGIERLMDYIFYQVAAINGFDQFGHYLRAGLIVNLCTNYATQPAGGCSAKFQEQGSSSSRLSSAQRQQLLAGAAALAGRQPASARSGSGTGSRSRTRSGPMRLPRIQLPGRLDRLLSGRAPHRSGASARGPRPGAAPSVTPQATSSRVAASPSRDPRADLLDYLLGPSS